MRCRHCRSFLQDPTAFLLMVSPYTTASDATVLCFLCFYLGQVVEPPVELSTILRSPLCHVTVIQLQFVYAYLAKGSRVIDVSTTVNVDTFQILQDINGCTSPPGGKLSWGQIRAKILHSLTKHQPGLLRRKMNTHSNFETDPSKIVRKFAETVS